MTSLKNSSYQHKLLQMFFQYSTKNFFQPLDSLLTEKKGHPFSNSALKHFLKAHLYVFKENTWETFKWLL